MSVEAIRLQNLMAFEDTGWITLKPVCLLFGKNSSGKSAITRALRFLKQSLEAKDETFLFNVENSVDVSSFNTILHRGYDVEEYGPGENEAIGPVTFAFRCALHNSALVDLLYKSVNDWRRRHNWSSIPVEKAQATVDIWLSYLQGGLNNSDRPLIWLSEVKVTCPWALDGVEEAEDYDVNVFLASDIGGVSEWTGANNWYMTSSLFQTHWEDEQDAWQDAWVELEEGFLPIIHSPDDPIPVPSLASSEELAYVKTLVEELRESIIHFLRGIEYVGPLRPAPERVYMLKPYELRKWQATGLAGFAAFLQGQFGPDELEQVNAWLQYMGLAYEVKAQPLVTDVPNILVSSVLVYESKEAADQNRGVHLVDCGFGISQVLPIIVAAIYVRGDHLLVVEQPELHLHGSTQTQLCDVYISNATRKRRTKAIEQAKIDAGEEEIQPLSESQLDALNARFLIETHSEHTLLRLQRRIAESSQKFIENTDDTFTTTEDTAFHFVSRDKSLGVSQAFYGEPDSMGVIELPDEFRGFFSDDSREARLWAGVRLGHPALDEEISI